MRENMSKASTVYQALSQSESRGEAKNDDERFSLAETSDEHTSSSQDSLDLVLLEIGSKKRKVRRKRRFKMGGISTFDGAESYEVSEPKFECLSLNVTARNRFAGTSFVCLYLLSAPPRELLICANTWKASNETIAKKRK